MKDIKRNATNSKTVLEGSDIKITDEMVDIFTLRHHPSNTYAMDRDSIETLALNIEEVGLLDYPYLRRVDDGGLQILSGHRRVEALKLLAKKDDKWRMTKARVAENLDDDTALIILHSGNLARPVSQEERTKLTQELEERVKDMRAKNPELRGKRTGEILAKLLGTSPASYNRALRLQKQLYRPLYEEMYNNGLLPLTYAWELCQQTQDYQKAFYNYLIEKKCKKRDEVIKAYKAYISTESKLLKEINADMKHLRNNVVQLHMMSKAKGFDKNSFDASDLRHARKHLNELIKDIENIN